MTEAMYYVFRGVDEEPMHGIAKIVAVSKNPPFHKKVQYLHNVNIKITKTNRSDCQKNIEQIRAGRECLVSSFILHQALLKLAQSGDGNSAAAYRECVRKSLETSTDGRSCGTPVQCNKRFLSWLPTDLLYKTAERRGAKTALSMDYLPFHSDYKRESYQRQAWKMVIRRGYERVFFMVIPQSPPPHSGNEDLDDLLKYQPQAGPSYCTRSRSRSSRRLSEQFPIGSLPVVSEVDIELPTTDKQTMPSQSSMKASASHVQPSTSRSEPSHSSRSQPLTGKQPESPVKTRARTFSKQSSTENTSSIGAGQPEPGTSQDSQLTSGNLPPTSKQTRKTTPVIPKIVIQSPTDALGIPEKSPTGSIGSVGAGHLAHLSLSSEADLEDSVVATNGDRKYKRSKDSGGDTPKLTRKTPRL